MKCRVCEGENLKLSYTQGHEDQFRLYRCRVCGLVNLDMDGLNLLDHQEKYAGEEEVPGDYEADPRVRQSFLFIKKYVQVSGNYMDIGCGGGGMLYYAQQDGWMVKERALSCRLSWQSLSARSREWMWTWRISWNMPAMKGFMTWFPCAMCLNT